MRPGKEIKQVWTGAKKIDICFCVIFGSHEQTFISGREIDYVSMKL